MPLGAGRSALVVATGDLDSYDLTLWFAGAAVAFTTGGSGIFPPGAYWPDARLGDDPDGHTWLVVEAYGRAGHGGWAWNLDDLCAAAPVD